MNRKKHRPEQITKKLPEADAIHSRANCSCFATRQGTA